uniref:Uncharacterized protein n=1 Tax=Meloidogyne hapla TaxID=6305 RepID=A0A1I8AYA6_MELHA
MKIARYYFEQIFNSASDYAHFDMLINPVMINLLFEENETKTPLQFNAKKAYFSISKSNGINDVLKFILNNFCISESIKMFANFHHGEVCNVVLNHIETSKNCSKIVAKILLRLTYFPANFTINLSEKAVNIKKWQDDKCLFTKYQLVNKYNPKIKFSIFIERTLSYIEFEIKRIY